MNGAAKILRPLGILFCKVCVKLFPCIFSNSGQLQRSGTKLLEHINAGLDCFKSNEGSNSPFDCIPDLVTGAFSLISGIVKLLLGILCGILYLSGILRRIKHGLSQLRFNGINRVLPCLLVFFQFFITVIKKSLGLLSCVTKA